MKNANVTLAHHKKKGLTKISSPFSSHYYKSIKLFLEIAVVQTFEAFAVTLLSR